MPPASRHDNPETYVRFGGEVNATRILEPEWLDTLPPHDPRARRSRHDLVRINALMGNGRIVATSLRALGPVGRIAEIGAGSGTFLLGALGDALTPGEAVLVDRQPVVDDTTRAAFDRRGWRAIVEPADVFDWLARGNDVFDVIVANLFLHHFDDRDVARMLALVARRTRVFVACEPRRAAFALGAAHLLGLVGCNDVSRHDAVVSVRAGFRGRELAALWPAEDGWEIEEAARGLFSHAFVAKRRDA